MQIKLKNHKKKMSLQVTPQIKEERHDEREINELAVQFAEKNKQKLLSQAPTIQQHNHASQQALQRAGGQHLISYFLKNNKQNPGESLIPPKKCEEKKKVSIDEESQKGRFGWLTMHATHIPYIFRNEDKYCSVRMIESRLLNDYLNRLPHEITNCISVSSFYITEIEAKLFNEINLRHSEGQFGREPFSQKDLVVKVIDAKCFYRFLDTCYKKLVEKPPKPSEYCGFVRINGESVVPYTVKVSVKYVPLFYFEGETDTLKTKAEKIDSWELAYLKFCCKVQGIRNELFASDTCSVVSLDDVKQYFPKDTQFEDWWPQKTAEPMRLLNHGPKSAGNWTQRPPYPNTSSSNNHSSLSSKQPNPVVSTLVNNNTHKSHPSITGLTNLTNNYNLYSQWANLPSIMNGQAAQAAQAQAQLYAAYGQYPMQNYLSLPDHVRVSSGLSNPANLMGNNSNLRPPPLVRSGQRTQTSTPYSTASRISNNLDNWREQNSNSNALRMHDSLINVSHQSSNPSSNNVISHGNMNRKSAEKVPPLIPVTNGMNNVSSQKSGRPIDKTKLTNVPQFIPDSSQKQPPYIVSKISVGGKEIGSINLGPLNPEPMIAVQDVIREWLPTASHADCLEVFVDVLRIPIYKANWYQVKALMEAWGETATPDVVPLIKATDLKKVIPQIKYLFQQQKEQMNKRLRT